MRIQRATARSPAQVPGAREGVQGYHDVVSGQGVLEGLAVRVVGDGRQDTLVAHRHEHRLRPQPRCRGEQVGPHAPAAVPRPGPEGLSGEDLGQGWTERMLFDTIAAVVPGARAVLRRLVELGGTVSYEEVQDHFAVHPETPIPARRSSP
ncbi:hypothetical protein [Streptomyces canus]|uniref:hypothetical protein n=1 Tax=Streptomyces canus TaxID=58343 RepID=UPI0030DED17A